MEPDQTDKLIFALVHVAEAEGCFGPATRAMLSAYPTLARSQIQGSHHCQGLDALMIAALNANEGAIKALAPHLDARARAGAGPRAGETALLLACQAVEPLESWMDEVGVLAQRLARSLLPFSDPEQRGQDGERALDRVLASRADALPLIEILAEFTDLQCLGPHDSPSALDVAALAGPDVLLLLERAQAKQLARFDAQALRDACPPPSTRLGPRGL